MPCVEVDRAQTEERLQVVGLQLDGLLQRLDGGVSPAVCGASAAEVKANLRVFGRELRGLFERADGFAPAPHLVEKPAEVSERSRRRRLKLNSALARIKRLVEALQLR